MNGITCIYLFILSHSILGYFTPDKNTQTHALSVQQADNYFKLRLAQNQFFCDVTLRGLGLLHPDPDPENEAGPL
jgi:hypothetical protein